jgi:hypothetical protein
VQVQEQAQALVHSFLQAYPTNFLQLLYYKSRQFHHLFSFPPKMRVLQQQQQELVQHCQLLLI